MGRKGLIRFRCWYCNRKHSAGWDQVGVRRVCNCGERYRVPRRAGISGRDRTVLDWILEFVIYGFGGGLLGLLFGFMLFRYSPWLIRRGVAGLIFVGVMALVGFLAGGLFGERGINWIGSHVRGLEEDD